MRIGMQIGPKIGAQGAEDLVSRYREIEEAGFDTAWTGNHLTHDAMTVLALAGTVTERIELGSSVVPTYPRHPMVMAQQALTTSAITGGRFTLGLGLSHKFIVEDWQGLKWSTPIHHLREYLTVLNGLLDGEQVVHEGEEYQVSLNTAPFTQLDVPDAPRPQVVIAALGPGMLKVTGELADGTNCWMCGQGYLESTLVPTINKAAENIAGGAMSGRNLLIPDTFDIQYMYKNAVNNYLHKISTCYLKNCSVNYGGDRFTAYDIQPGIFGEGAPPQNITMSLEFDEMEVLTRESIYEGF